MTSPNGPTTELGVAAAPRHEPCTECSEGEPDVPFHPHAGSDHEITPAQTCRGHDLDFRVLHAAQARLKGGKTTGTSKVKSLCPEYNECDSSSNPPGPGPDQDVCCPVEPRNQIS